MYKTIQGDTWDIVAKKLLGSEMYMSDLIRVNPDYQEYVIFPAGVELNVPKVEHLPQLNNFRGDRQQKQSDRISGAECSAGGTLITIDDV